MNAPQALAPSSLAWRCDLEQFDFETTDEASDLEEILGQDRAISAVQFGIGIRREGYNLYVLGPSGVGKRTVVEQYLRQQAAQEPTPADWCYVNNFQDPNKPKMLELPAGRGAKLRLAMAALIEDLLSAIPAALEIEEHQNRIQEIEQEAKNRHDSAFEEIAEKAKSENIQIVRSPGGFALAPIKDDEIVNPEEYEKLPPEEQKRIEEGIGRLQQELHALVKILPQWRKEAHDKIKELNREATKLAIDFLHAKLKEEFAHLPLVADYLNEVEQDVIENSEEFNPAEESPGAFFGIPIQNQTSFSRYEVNLLVDNSQTKGAPVIFEDHPTYQNLLGRTEHQTQMGALVTRFSFIKPGALHRANGGYLVVEALRLLFQPFVWEGLKRALYSGNLKIESLGETLSLISTVSLEPEPIPLNIKVVLLGDRMLYYLLHQRDPDFAELFKASADFDESIDRNEEACRLYARFIATMVRREKYRPFDCSAVARVLEQSARITGDSEKLSMHMRSFADLLREADYWAENENAEVVSASHVQTAIDQQIYRHDRIRQRMQEEIQRGTILIASEDEKVGQVNGLSVLDLGNFSFGRPSRITATARLGKGEIIDIEREVELGGSIHSKGVLILSSFLAARYAKNRPLSLRATLGFEQSYGMVDGDSASVGELCALLSALSNAPIKQSLAITGSVNQHGQVQPIGGVNEKIEGFFDICNQRGLTGQQGVVIPSSNVKHLMLKREVIEAAAQGKFHIYPVETVDQAIELLFGIPAGDPDENGKYPPESLNAKVEERILELTQLAKQFAANQKRESNDE